LVIAAAGTALTLMLLGTGASPQRSPGRITTGALELPMPSGWRRVHPTAAGSFGLVDSVALRTKSDAPGMLIIGKAPSAITGPLPEQLSATLGFTPTPQLVTLGGSQYYRYLNVTPRAGGAPESVYSLRTTAGTMLAVCAARRPGGDLAARCEHVLGAARLTPGTTTANPEPAYAAAFTAVIRKLNAIRASAGPRLRGANDAQEQAIAATTLANGHVRAAAALEQLDAGLAAGANASVASSIRVLGDAYRSLGQAALRGDTGAYDAASAAVTRDSATLSSAFARLRALGYQVQ
jgi:hypothetical protein